jgi:DNA processing protein
LQELIFKIATSLIPGIGDIGAKKLIAYCGGAEAIFKEKKASLIKIPGIGEVGAKKIINSNAIKLAEEELNHINKHNINVHYFLDPSYPQRLLHCEDGPIILYTKGHVDLNPKRMVSIVGTRKATIKGKEFTEKLIEELKPFNPVILSGLAYGIDISAHKSAIKQNLKTMAVLASGLDDVYPKTHHKYAKEMQEFGGLISDYRCNSSMVPANFAERNRIVAGMSDVVVVIESSAKGGSLITADLANGYNRDVFAVPGRTDDSQSVGCNRLIKTNKAALIESAKDIQYLLGWELNQKPKENQRKLFVELSKDEEKIIKAFRNETSISVDELALNAEFPMSQTTGILLGLEFKGIIRSLPGKVFELLL